jgi:phosphatidylglycerol:prolipoprotein diacylglycerol transferase
LSDLFPWILTLAVVAGLAWLLLPAPAQTRTFPSRRTGDQAGAAFEAGLATLAGGLLGARLGFAVTHTAYFSQDFWEIVRLWRGGLSGPGAVLGAACGLWLYAVVARQPFWPLADGLAAPSLLVAAAAWLGCLADGCAFGLPADGPLRLPVSPGLMQLRLPRWPTQAIGALACLVPLLFLLRRGSGAFPSGVPAMVAVITISLSAVALDFLRGDPAPMLAGLRLEALGWTAIAMLGGLAFALHRRALARG